MINLFASLRRETKTKTESNPISRAIWHCLRTQILALPPNSIQSLFPLIIHASKLNYSNALKTNIKIPSFSHPKLSNFQVFYVHIFSHWHTKKKPMAEEKESTSIPLSQAENGGIDPEDPAKSPPTSPNSSTRKVHFPLLPIYFFLMRF